MICNHSHPIIHIVNTKRSIDSFLDNDMFVCYSRYDKMSRQVIIEIRLGCQKRIICRQDPVPQGHEVASFQNTMVNKHLGRRL